MDEGGYLIIVNSEMEQECIRQNGGGGKINVHVYYYKTI